MSQSAGINADHLCVKCQINKYLNNTRTLFELIVINNLH